jgi:hypothetical protein
MQTAQDRALNDMNFKYIAIKTGETHNTAYSEIREYRIQTTGLHNKHYT